MNDVKKLLHVNSPEGTTRLVLPKLMRGTLHPSPGKKVQFADGTVLHMNRKERRRNKLYGNLENLPNK